MSKFKFNGIVWNTKNLSIDDINKRLNENLGAPAGRVFAMVDVVTSGKTSIVTVLRQYKEYSIKKGEQRLCPEDVSIILGYNVPAPFYGYIDISYDFEDVEKMFDEKNRKLKILSQSEDMLVLEIENV